MNQKQNIILGIDPGSRITGYGLISVSKQKISLINCGVIQLNNLEGGQAAKLKRIFERVLSIVDEFKPGALAIEAPFYAKNVQATLKIGRAQGVAMAAGMLRNVPVYEYAPRKVKKAVTGVGTASKEQVAALLTKLLPGLTLTAPKLEGVFDAYDAIAVAVCHYYQKEKPVKTTQYGGWEAFIAENPNRINK